MKRCLTLLIIAGILFLFSHNQAIAASPKFYEKTTSLGTIPEGYKVIDDSIRMNSTTNHVSYVVYTDNTHKSICLDKAKSPEYYAVQPGMPIFGPKGRRHVYIAYKKKDGGAVVVVDGKPSRTYDNVDNFRFSATGSRYAFRAVKNDKQCVVVDGQEGPWYRGIPLKNNFRFSPDSKLFAYVAFKDEGCVLVLNGIEQQHHFKLIADVAFSLGSKRIAYKGLVEGSLMQGSTQKWILVVDGKKQNVYNYIYDLIFSPDTKHLAYIAIKDKAMVLVVDGNEKKPFPQYGLPVFSKDSKKLAYTYKDKEYFYFVLNKKEYGPFQKIGKFYFSPDSSMFAFIAQAETEKWHIIVNGRVSPEYDMVDAFKFSPDSSSYAFGASPEEGRGQIIVDSSPGTKYLSVGEPHFSPDSSHIVHRGQKTDTGKIITVLDGRETGNEYHAISPYVFSDDSNHYACSAMIKIMNITMLIDGKEFHQDQQCVIIGNPYFSPDSNYVAYHIQTGPEEWKLVVNGFVLDGTYSGFMKDTPIIFDSPNQFHTIALRSPGPEFLLIEVKIPETIKLKTSINSQ